MPTPAPRRASRDRRTRNSTRTSSLLATVVVVALLTVLSTGSAGGSAASLQDTASGELLTVQAASINAAHTVDASRNRDFSAGNLTNVDAVTVTNTGTIDASFATSTTRGATSSTLASAITVVLWQTATASGCATPVNSVSGRWGDATLQVSGQLAPLASVVVCVHTTISNLPAQTSGDSLKATVSTLLSRSSWTSTASSTIAQKYVDHSPTAPSALALSATTGNSTTLTWAPSTDDVAVTGYDVYRNTESGRALLGQATSPEFAITGLASDSTYTFTVIARDGAGHSSAPAQVTVTTLDVTPPNVAPVLSGTLSGTTAALNWTAAADKNGIKEYQVYLGATKISTVTGSTLTHTPPALVAGESHEYTVRAVDPAGNVTASNVVTLAVPPANISCSNSGIAAAALTWAKPAGGQSRTYEIVVNNRVIGVVTSSAATIEYVLTRDRLDTAGVKANGTYTAQVRLQGQPVVLAQRTVVLEPLWYLFFTPAVRCT